MNTEFLYVGPIGILYYVGPAWALLVVVFLLGLLPTVASIKKNRPQETLDNRVDIRSAWAAHSEATREGTVSWKKIKKKLGSKEKQQNP